jgi:hypothetical protein
MSITLAQLGLIQEYGTPRIPPRPFLGPAIENNREQLSALQRLLLQQILRGEMTPKLALAKLGALAQGLVQQQIRATLTPPNAPSTIKRKGSSHPLIDTGQMVQNVAWEYDE